MDTSKKRGWFRRYGWLVFLLIIPLVTMGGCFDNSVAQQSVNELKETEDESAGTEPSTFRERVVMRMVERISDNPAKIFYLYIFGGNGTLRSSYVCLTRPLSSTESLEPNHIWSWSNFSYGVDAAMDGGVEAYTTEAMGRDGTYGEPVPYRICITPEGHYHDFGAMGTDYEVSDVPLTFPAPESRIDSEQYARQLIAEKAIAEGGCIDSNLNVVPCDGSKDGTSDGSGDATTSPIPTAEVTAEAE